MKRWSRKSAALVLVLLLALCAVVPVASAGGGTVVYVNNIFLSSSSPYWKNGNAPASAGDWNAYFNVAANTLTLRDAVINTPSDSTVDTGTQALVYADGNVTVVLEGNCELSYTGADGHQIAGIYSNGTLTVKGSGSAILRIATTANQSVVGFAGSDGLTVEGGTLDILLTSSDATAAFASGSTILFSGGSVVAVCYGSIAYVVNVIAGTFRMTGGSVKAIAQSLSNYAIAVQATSAYLEGGEGFFKASASEMAFGFLVGEFTLIVTGGEFAASGTTYAAYPTTGSNLLLTGRSVYGSENSTGSGMRLILPGRSTTQTVSLSDLSPYRYLWFTADAAMPQTGDAQTPWLWAGLMLCALLGAAALILRLRKRTA